ncbi:hypothetical protein EMIT093MI4_190056 [Pseudomonas sp. IT-93MI4]
MGWSEFVSARDFNDAFLLPVGYRLVVFSLDGLGGVCAGGACSAVDARRAAMAGAAP